MTANIQQERKLKHNEGVSLVERKLASMNLAAVAKSGYAKGLPDIAFRNPVANKSKGIKVRCSDKKKVNPQFFVATTYLKTIKKELEDSLTRDFVFVDMSGEPPRFFIISKEELRDIGLTVTDKWLDDSKHRHGKTREEMITNEKKKQPLWVRLSDIEKYENNWRQILNDL
jgi:hypothetical protein